MAQDPAVDTTLAILAGASIYKRSQELAQGKRFEDSAREFREYLLNDFALPASNLLDLFDKEDDPDTLLEQIENFLKERGEALKDKGGPQDLLLYYLGHGGFTTDNRYRLAVARTRQGSEDTSSIRMGDLARTIKGNAGPIRKYLILDCCFAAEAFKYFQSTRQSTPTDAVHAELRESLPPATGTTMLCSSSAVLTSKAPESEKYTMFSGALLRALREGIPRTSGRITMAQLGDHVSALIREQYKEDAVRPELLSPDQRDDELKDLPLFPNPALKRNFDCSITVKNSHSVTLSYVSDAGKTERVEGEFADALASMTVQRLSEWLNIGIRLDQDNTWKGNCDAEDLRLLGVNLYRLLFGQAKTREAFTGLYQRFQTAFKQTPDIRMRVRLTFGREAEDIARLPWEFLLIPESDDSTDGVFVAGKRAELNFMRYVTTAAEPRPAKQEPLRILVAVYRPSGASGFLAEEQEKLVTKLTQVPNTQVEVLLDGSARKLGATLERFAPHVVHFVGFGARDEKGKCGLALVGRLDDSDTLEYGADDTKPLLPLTGEELVSLFGDESRPGLVFLHASKTPAGPEAFRSQEAFKACARELVLATIPTVITMQFTTPHDEVGVFAAALYTALAKGSNPDEAVKAGRMALGQFYLPRWTHLRFGAPLVYMQNDEPLVRPPQPKDIPIEKTEERKREMAPATGSVGSTAIPRPSASETAPDTVPPPSHDRGAPSSSFQKS